jgi:acetate kinase
LANKKARSRGDGRMKGSILSLNAGSSSVKFALFNAADNLAATVRGEIEDLDSTPRMTARDAGGTVLAERRLPSGLISPSTRCWISSTIIWAATG